MGQGLLWFVSPTSTKGKEPQAFFYQLMQFWGGREEARPGLKAVGSQMSKNSQTPCYNEENNNCTESINIY